MEALFEAKYPVTTRFAEIDALLTFIKQGKSAQLIALPGVGRSTLLRLLAYNKDLRTHHLGEAQHTYHFVFTSFSEVRRKPLGDVTKFLFLSLLDSLRQRERVELYKTVQVLFEDALKLNDELVLFQAFKQAIDFLSQEKEITVVFLFDRFEEYIPQLTSDFFSQLRTLRDRAKYRFAVVFSHHRTLEEAIEPSLMTEYYDFVVGNVVYLSITDEPGLSFRIQHLEDISNTRFDPELKSEIIKLTGGFPRLVKECLDSSLNGSLENLSEFLLTHRNVQRPLYEIWLSLTPSEQDFLLSESTYEITDMDYPHLSKTGLLRESKVAIPLFETFLKSVIAKKAPIDDKKHLVFDESTQEIRKGDILISEKLTRSEYRLLPHLMKNAEKIIDREEIIHAVWSGTVSTAGVTDQALDQLIFRVRRKIEDDPNNPQHLHTIKGRGIRLEP